MYLLSVKVAQKGEGQEICHTLPHEWNQNMTVFLKGLKSVQRFIKITDIDAITRGIKVRVNNYNLLSPLATDIKPIPIYVEGYNEEKPVGLFNLSKTFKTRITCMAHTCLVRYN